MQSCPLEDDEDWGPGSDSDGAEDTELRLSGGPLRCWQRAGLKRLVIDERRPPTVRPARYDAGPCCAVCGRRRAAGLPLAPLFDNTSFVSMADVVRDVVGLEFTVSENPNENVICGGCRGHLLALHTMRGWLCDLQKRFARMVVCTNNSRRAAKILMPKAYRGVDFFSREAPLLNLPTTGSERLGALDSVTRPEENSRDALVGELDPAAKPGVTAGSVSGHCDGQTTAERGLSGRESGPASVTDQGVTDSGTAEECVVRQLLGVAPTSVVPEALPDVSDDRPSDTSISQTRVVTISAAQPPQPLQQQPQPVQQPPPPPPQLPQPHQLHHQQQEQMLQSQPLQQQPPRPLQPLQAVQPPPTVPPPASLSQPLPSSQAPPSLPAPPPTPISQPIQLTQPTMSTAPATPPRPAAAAAAPGGDSDLLDPFEECSISDLLVLRSPLAVRPPAASERPPPSKLKKIAPKLDRREAPLPAPIVLNIMSVPVPVSTSSSPSFKAIVPRRPAADSDGVPALAPPPSAPPGRRPPRRLAAASRDSRRPRRAPDAEPPPPQDPAGYSAEPMVFYNPDGSIPAPPYSGQVGAAPVGMAGAGAAGGAAEYAQLQTVQPEPPPPTPAPPTVEYRPNTAFEVPQDEIERYAADYGVYMDESVPAEQQVQTQHQQQQQEQEPQHHQQHHQQQLPPPSGAASAVGSSSAPTTHRVALESGRDPSYRVMPRVCKPCGEPLSSEMHMVRKHFVESHMGLERNDFTGSILYRCRVCSAESTSLESLKKHFGTRHVSRSALVCGHCDETFPRLEALQYHLRRQHHGRSECSECGVTFLSSRALSIHLNKVHQIERRPRQPQPRPLPVLPPPPVAGEVTIDTAG